MIRTRKALYGVIGGWLVISVFAWVLTSDAAPMTGYDSRLPMQPDEKLTVACEFAGHSVSNIATTVTQVAGAADGSASAILTNSSGSGSRCNMTIAPANRHGRQYQVHCLATTTASPENKIACDILVVVKKVVFQPSES